MKIKYKLTKKSYLEDIDFKKIVFGRVFGDHIFSADFDGSKWENLQIIPYKKMKVFPSLVALHYGQSIFEGMKALSCDDDRCAIFRLDKHFERFNRSAKRTLLPQIPKEIFTKGMTELLKIDKKWIPSVKNSFLYIRPFMFATDTYIGLHPSEKAKFLIITSPCPVYYQKPLKVIIETTFTRAVEGGMGAVKVAGNYANSFYPTAIAKEKKFQQVIWTDAKEHKYIEEAGTMNIMCVIDQVLVTPLASETILNGITRQSILEIAKEWGIKYEERQISIEEIIKAIEDKRLQEIFGVGTAVKIATIQTIGYKDKIWQLPEIKENALSKKLSKELDDIMKGKKKEKEEWLTFI